ncbi:MAG: guanylate kinase [Gammaproteobacteria bacterium]
MKDITGKLIVISAPSGTGKTTVVKKLLQQSTNLEASVSFTTRKMRENEKEGLDYFFVREKTFTNMIQNDDFLEHATVFGNFYGTEKKSVSENLKKGVNVILEIDWQGALQIKSSMPSCVMIFLIPPSKEVLLARLKNRGTDSDQEIAYRFNQAVLDLEQSNKFDHVLVNDQLDKVVTEIALCIEGKTNKINQSKKVAESLKSFFETN